jgi:succinoglycan biosynthesis transport protein ExoP
MYRLRQEKQIQRDENTQPQQAAGGSLLDDLHDAEDTVERGETKLGNEQAPQQAKSDEKLAAKAKAASLSKDNLNKEESAPAQSAEGWMHGFSNLNQIGLKDIFHWLRRGIIWIILVMILCAALAVAYASMIPPRFTAYTDVVINPSNLNVVNDGVYTPSQQRDTLVLEVESKLRMLTSRNVLERAVRELKLDQDAEFTQEPPLARLKSFWRPVEEGDNSVGALRSLGERVSATRDARSFVVTLAVWSNDAEKSVEISKAIMQAFETELFESNSDGSRRAAADLNQRLEELRVNVTEAEKAVEEYRSQNNLQQVNGQLASDQASSEVNAQVLAAQQRVIQDESRLEQMESAIRQNRTTTAAIFDSQTMNTIREQYSLLQQQIGAMTLTYGSRHPRLTSAGAERQMLEQGINAEAQRILDIARASVEESKSSLAALQKRANSEQARVFNDNAVMVTLRDLERNARSVAAIYETYLTRARQITEQQAIDSTNIRIISQPVAPNYRTWPPGKLTFLIGGAILGAMIGAGIALAFGFLGFLRRQARVAKA